MTTFFHNWELYNTLCTRSTRTGGVQSANYSQSSLHCPSRKASRRKRIWSTQEASNLLLLASKISPAAEKRRSTAVDVAGQSGTWTWVSMQMSLQFTVDTRDGCPTPPRKTRGDFDPCLAPPRPTGKKSALSIPWWVTGKPKTLPLCQCHQGSTSRAFRN